MNKQSCEQFWDEFWSDERNVVRLFGFGKELGMGGENQDAGEVKARLEALGEQLIKGRHMQSLGEHMAMEALEQLGKFQAGLLAATKLKLEGGTIMCQDEVKGPGPGEEKDKDQDAGEVEQEPGPSLADRVYGIGERVAEVTEDLAQLHADLEVAEGSGEPDDVDQVPDPDDVDPDDVEE